MSVHKNIRQRKQLKVRGTRYAASVKYKKGIPAGFYLWKERVKTFHSGKGFSDPKSIDEALEWAIENM